MINKSFPIILKFRTVGAAAAASAAAAAQQAAQAVQAVQAVILSQSYLFD